jgi:hypothetical protein
MSNTTSGDNSPSGKSDILTTPPQAPTGMAALKTCVDDMVDREQVGVSPNPSANSPGFFIGIC